MSPSAPQYRLARAALVALFCALPAGLAAAATPQPAPSGKIAPWVLDHGATGDATEFLVVLGDRADLTPATRLTDRLARRRFVRDVLYSRAQASQAPLLAWLRAHGVEHRSFYIVNAVWVRATLDVATAIAARPEVERLDGNPELQNLEPVRLDPAEGAALERLLAPQAIEPGITDTRAPEVWALGATGQGVVVGSADTGVQWDHPALKGHYRGWNGVTASHDYNWHDAIHTDGGVCGPDAPAPCDDHNHGTHTTGTAVGSDGGANQIGMAPGARFIACRNMDRGAGTPARYIECMEWFLAPYPVGGTTAQGNPAMAPDVTINSWACPGSEGCVPATLQAAVEAQRAAGIMFVGAAGNSGSGCSTVSDPPAIYDATYSVGAYDVATGDLASFSSRGPVTVDGSNRMKPDIAAPGVTVRSSVRGGGYASTNWSGTSMATPHVVGAVALLWSARPGLVNQIGVTEDFLDNNAVHVSSALCSSGGSPNNLFGWGKLDIKAAVDAATLGVEPRPETEVAGLWLGPAWPNPSHRSTLLRFRLEREGTVRLAVYSAGGQRLRTLLAGIQTAGEHSLRWDGRSDAGDSAPAGLYLVRLEAAGRAASRKLIWLGE